MLFWALPFENESGFLAIGTDVARLLGKTRAKIMQATMEGDERDGIYSCPPQSERLQPMEADI
jgi:hypothetical protein